MIFVFIYRGVLPAAHACYLPYGFLFVRSLKSRCLQEEEVPGRGGGATFPGDDWLEGLKENMDYSVQTDR